MAITADISEYDTEAAHPQLASAGECILFIPGIDEPWPDDLAQATAFANEESLSAVWNTAEEDEAWRDI